jgi:hypothetical protein
MRKVRAIKDRILAPFLNAAGDDLNFHNRFYINAVIRKLDLKPHAPFVWKEISVVREILQETFGTLIPITGDGEVAGRGKRLMGFARNVAEYADLVDESLLRKRQCAGGIGDSHNEMKQQFEAASGLNGNPLLSVEVIDDKYLEEEREEILRIQEEARAEERKLVSDKLEIDLGDGIAELAKRTLSDMFKK